MPRRIRLADDITREDYSRYANGLWCALRSMHPPGDDDFSMSLDRQAAVGPANDMWKSYYAEAGLWGDEDYEEWPPAISGETAPGSACDGDRGAFEETPTPTP